MFQSGLMLGWQDKLEHRGIRTEDLRKHSRGEAGRDLPSIAGSLMCGQLVTFLKRDGDRLMRVGIHEKIVLGEEPGEQHPVPVLVGALSDQVCARIFVVAICV